jgi:hypothetical protein
MAIQISTEQLKAAAVTSAKIDLTGTFDYSSGVLRAASPSGNSDVANKQYVDNIAAGLHFKDSVELATTANVTLSGEQTIDGVTTSASRILVKDQTDATENGIYVTASGSWSRAADMDAGDEFPAAAFFVREGTANADLGYVCTNDDAPILGTDNITFTQFTGAANITAGAALSKTGNTLDVEVDNSSIEVSADALQVKALGITNDMLAGSIANAKLSNSTISGIALGSNLNSLSVVTGSALAMTSYNGSAASSDLAVQVDDSSIEVSSNALRVKASGISNQMLAGSITAEKLQKGLGLTDNAGNLEIASGVAGDGLALSSQVLSVNVDDSSIEINTDSLRVKASGITNAMLAGSIEASKLALGNGLDNNAGALEVQVDDSSIEIDGVSNNLKVKDGGITSAKVSFIPNYENYSGNGSATTFDLSSAIDSNFAGGVVAYRNGLAMELVQSNPSGQDQYTIDATGGAGGVGQIIFGTAPNNGDTIGVLYWS